MTKVILNRMKLVLPSIISPAQSSFVPGRQITDNIVIVQEVVHTMKTHRNGKGLMMLKLDLEKAYDKVRWDFLQDTLVTLCRLVCLLIGLLLL